MQKITKAGEPAVFIKDVRKVKDFLPNSNLISMSIDEDLVRIMVYEEGTYKIESSNKTKGTSPGDICPICGIGEVVDAGGCVTCSRCGAQLKCGL